jgi:hypothetical protein
MSYRTAIRRPLVGVLTSAALAAAPTAQSHTRLMTPTINEGTTVYNASVIGHGCHDHGTHENSLPVIATSIVFPDGTDSIITTRAVGSDPSAAATAYEGHLEDFVQNWGNIPQLIYSNEVFTQEAEKFDALGNVIGLSATGGKLPGTVHGLVPFKTDPVIIEPNSCAASVTFVIAMADICKITKADKFGDGVVNLWTPEVGSIFHGIRGVSHGFDSPSTLKVLRTTPLPPSCNGADLDVTVTPSAAQINRDLPIKLGKQQYWPKK